MIVRADTKNSPKKNSGKSFSGHTCDSMTHDVAGFGLRGIAKVWKMFGD